MGDTEKKPAGETSGAGAGSDPPPSSGKGFASTHRVKQLLETYIGTADKTLTGPAQSSLENPEGGHFRRLPAIRLPPDVKLSKAHPLEEEEEKVEGAEKGPAEANPAKIEHEKIVNNGLVTLSR